MRRGRVAGVTAVLLLVASGCSVSKGEADIRSPSTSPPSSSPSVAAVDASERLFALGRAWLQTKAEVTYATVAPIKGQATSTHQCLRAMVETRLDLVEALRNCSRQGRLVLSWDSPDRWRMDITTPLRRFTVLSGPGGRLICPATKGDLVVCRPVSDARAVAVSGFGFLFEPPTRILDAIGATDVTPTQPSQQLEGISVECFAANGPEVHVEWCYSPEGVLLSFLRGSASLGWESLEASSVS